MSHSIWTISEENYAKRPVPSLIAEKRKTYTNTKI